jgi:hypothetical protein
MPLWRRRTEAAAKGPPAIAALWARQTGWIRGKGKTLTPGVPVASLPSDARAMVEDVTILGVGPGPTTRLHVRLGVNDEAGTTRHMERDLSMPSEKAARVYRGATLPVVLDPADPQHVDIDWTRL